MAIRDWFKDKRNTADSDSSFVPASLYDQVDTLMLGATLLLAFSDTAHDELDQRTRAAACAVGAMDCLCQGYRISIDDESWMKLSLQIATRYLILGDKTCVTRFGAEHIGSALAMVTSGHPKYAMGWKVGGSNIARLLRLPEGQDPSSIFLKVTEYIQNNRPPA